MPTLDIFARNQLTKIQHTNSYRSLKPTIRLDNGFVIYNGNKLLSFSCNNYYGISGKKQVRDIANKLLNKYNHSSSASRLITGNHPLYTLLENKLALLYNQQSACVFGSGYLTNIGVIPALMNKNDLILADKYVHASIIDGIKLSNATFIRFKHNNLEDCHNLILKYRKKHRNCMIITENVFSMDGDLAPVTALQTLATDYDCWLYSDGAHNLADKVKLDLNIGTLSKALASNGGYVCASNEVIELIRNTARSLIYSTALQADIIAQAIAAIDYTEADKFDKELPIKKARLFTEIMGMKPAASQIVPVIIKDNLLCKAMFEKLMENGFLVSAILPPTVPKNAARLRLTFARHHQDSDIEKLASLIKEYCHL
jgi:8-amino-7-oxononanoate synthase